MSKQCQVCKTINHSAANHCTNCGNTLPDKELPEEDKLRIELFEAKETIQGLSRALAEMQKNGHNLEEAQKTIADYKTKLTKEKQDNSKYSNLISEKDSEITLVSEQLDTARNSRTAWIVALLILCVILGVSLMSSNKEIDNKQYSNSTLEEKISSLEIDNNALVQKTSSIQKDKDNLSEKIDSISAYYPLVIKSLKIGNTYPDGIIETDFGNALYSSSAMFLKPQIEYIGLKNTSITLYQKLYKDGILSRNDSSPEGFSAKSDIYISDPGVSALSAWGNQTKGFWPAGNYRYEIWYNDMCLKTENFILY